jgi:hypothetical protein
MIYFLNKKEHTVGTEANRKITERVKIDTPNTQIQQRALS